jgi:hypothetical protein
LNKNFQHIDAGYLKAFPFGLGEENATATFAYQSLSSNNEKIDPKRAAP